MSTIHFGTDGWRARFDEGFTPDNVVRVADAVGKIWSERHPGKTVIVGYDTRKDAARYADLAAQVLAAHGLVAKVSQAYCPTPTLCWSVAKDPNACGGLMLTASHNPGEYLGIKIRMEDGGASPKEFTDKVEALITNEVTQARGAVEHVDLMGPYLADLVTLVDADAIRQAGLKVVHDPMYGASRGYMGQVLSNLGVEVIEIHCEPLTNFGGLHPEPIKPWIDECEATVLETQAQAGLINDGDADRVGAVDSTGAFVSPHKIMTLLVGHLAAKGQTGRVVTTFSGSSLLKRQCARLGLELTITPVGFKWIYAEMLKGDVLVGGEESGGIGLPGHVLERDGLLMDLFLCEMMALSGKNLHQLVAELEAELGTMHYERRDLRLTEEQVAAFKKLLPTLEPTTAAGLPVTFKSKADGLYLEFPDDAWLLMRTSGTEPLVRVYAEADNDETKRALLEWGCDLAQGK